VDRGWLEQQLAAGRSIESIAREVDRDPSTVSYWVRKHGLQSSQAERHAARGGIERDLLEQLVAEGLSTRQIAAHVNPARRPYGTGCANTACRPQRRATVRRPSPMGPEVGCAAALGTDPPASFVEATARAGAAYAAAPRP
jgi:transposase-like protein